MFIIKLANINILINNNYSYLENLCKDYIINEKKYDFEVTVSKTEIDEETKSSDLSFSKGYIESICCYRKLCLELPKYDAFLLHASVVKVNDKAYAFSAKPGTGKTTHTRLWKQLLGDKMMYINGDKPIIRIINNKPIAFGTPWCGKENYGNNTFALLDSLCFIERDIENSICKLDKKEIIPKIIHQILLPKDELMITKTLKLLDLTISNINIYLLKCNMNIDAAKLSYNYITK